MWNAFSATVLLAITPPAITPLTIAPLTSRARLLRWGRSSCVGAWIAVGTLACSGESDNSAGPSTPPFGGVAPGAGGATNPPPGAAAPEPTGQTPAGVQGTPEQNGALPIDPRFTQHLLGGIRWAASVAP